MKQAIKRTIAAALSISLLIPVVASAHPGHDHGEVPIADKAKQDLQATLQTRKEARAAKLETNRTDMKERLDASKKKICERHETKINNLIDAMNKRRQTAFDQITKVSTEVLAYSNDRSLSFERYDEIVAKISAAKSAAQSTMSAQQSATTFDCASEQPRADMLAFKEKRLDSVDALTLYRDSVKELVAAVKQAAKDVRANSQGGTEQ